MKARNIMFGVFGLTVLMSLSAASSYGGTLVNCSNGTISKVGAGFIDGGKYYKVTVSCADGSTTWTLPITNDFKIYPDKDETHLSLDGMYATALTAIATTKNVSFAVYTVDAPQQANSIYYLANIAVK